MERDCSVLTPFAIATWLSMTSKTLQKTFMNKKRYKILKRWVNHYILVEIIDEKPHQSLVIHYGSGFSSWELNISLLELLPAVREIEQSLLKLQYLKNKIEELRKDQSRS